MDTTRHCLHFVLYVAKQCDQAHCLTTLLIITPHTHTAAVMLRNLVSYIKKLAPPLFYVTIGIILATNAALCIAFKFYFFVD